MDETRNHPDYERHAAEWRRTLPHATPQQIHEKVANHLAFKEKAKKDRESQQAVKQVSELSGGTKISELICQYKEPPVPPPCAFKVDYAVHFWLKGIAILLALIFLSLIVGIITHAEPAPADPVPAATYERIFARIEMLPQAGTVPIPLPVTGTIACSNCSATGGFADNSAFTVGTTTIAPIGAYYSTSTPSISSGNAGRVRMDSNSYLFTDCVVGCSGGATTPSDAFANPTTAGLSFSFLAGFNGTTWDRLRDDSNKYLYVDCATGCSSSSFADNSSFTAGTTSIGITGGWYASSPTACTSGNACAPSMTSDRKMFVQSFQGTSPWVVSNGGTFAVQAAQSGTWNVANTGTFAVQAAQSGTWTVTGAGGTFPVTGTFWQATQPVSGTFWQTTQPVSGTFWQTTQPVSAASLPLPSGASISADQCGYSGSNCNVNVAQVGTTAIVANPCDEAIPTFLPINEATGTTTQIIAGTSSKHTYICSIFLIAGAATNVNLLSGTGTNCGTVNGGILGGTTAATGPNVAANGGFTMGNGRGAVARDNTTADNICYAASASNQVSGVIGYVQE